MFGPNRVLGETKTVLCKLNVHTNHLGRPNDDSKGWGYGLRFSISNQPQSKAADHTVSTKAGGPGVEQKQPKKKQHRHELRGQTKFPFLLVGWPWTCWMGSHEEHWHILFRKSHCEMLLVLPLPVSGWWNYVHTLWNQTTLSSNPSSTA